MLPENMCRTIGRRRVNFSSPQRNGQPQEAARPGLLRVQSRGKTQMKTVLWEGSTL